MSQRVCVDVYPPSILAARAIGVRGKQWSNGQVLPIHFMSGSQSDHSQVMDWVQAWLDQVNLHFEWVDDPAALIRINFDASGASWSYIGNDATLIPALQPTMNFGWEIDRSTVLHEFGHMLGLGHEHQNPEGGIIWDEQAVIDDLSGPPNFWDEQSIRFNVLDKYGVDQVNGTDFDAESIMLYSFPGSWTLNMPEGTPWNTELSDVDESFISSQYPRSDEPGPDPGPDPDPVEPDPVEPDPVEPDPVEPDPVEPDPVEPDDGSVMLPVVDPSPLEAEIGSAGEEDVYTIVIEEEAKYEIETFGKTDLTMTLLRDGVKIDFDDDGGRKYNSKIVRVLVPGEYKVQIRHWSEDETGKYKIRCMRQQ